MEFFQLLSNNQFASCSCVCIRCGCKQHTIWLLCYGNMCKNYVTELCEPFARSAAAVGAAAANNNNNKESNETFWWNSAAFIYPSGTDLSSTPKSIPLVCCHFFPSYRFCQKPSICRAYHICNTEKQKKLTQQRNKSIRNQSVHNTDPFLLRIAAFFDTIFQTVHGNNVGFRACHSVGWVALSYSATAYSFVCLCLRWYVCLRIFVLSNGHDFGL